MKKVLICTYGINSKGKGINRLTDALKEDYDEIRTYHHTVRHFYHGWSWNSVVNDAVGVIKIASEYDHPVDICGHSHGALIMNRAMWLGLEVRNAYFFGAAMSSDQEPYHFYEAEHIYNYHNVDDRALKFGALLPKHLYGSMGIQGYRGVPRVPTLHDFSMRMGKGWLRHSGYFDPENIPRLRHSMLTGTPID